MISGVPPAIIFSQVNQQLANPFWLYDPSQVGIVKTTGTLFDWAIKIQQAKFPGAGIGSYDFNSFDCTCAPDGMPGPRPFMEFQYLVWA